MAKIEINPDKFIVAPFTELNSFINAIIEEKKPFMISAKLIKVECSSAYLEINNEVRKCNVNSLCYDRNINDLVYIDSRKLY